MSIRYWQPLRQALGHTGSLLLGPLDPGRWLALGLVAWLIHLGQAGGSAAGADPEFRAHVVAGDVSGALDALSHGLVRAIPEGVALLLLLTAGSAVILVSLALLWVGCRMRFVWLEQLTAGDHAIGPAWRRHARLGDQFFLWKLGFFLASALLVVPLAVFAGVFGALGLGGGAMVGSLAGWFLLGLAVLVLGLVLGYVDFFAESFVTVIMHRRGVGVLEGWRQFRTLFDAAAGSFLLVGLVKLLLRVAAALTVFVFGLATLMLGWLLVALPYVGTVVQLPLLVAQRTYDLHWLGQLATDLAPPAARTAAAVPARPSGAIPGGSTPGSDPTP